jgi:hypothetical protein
MSAHGWFELDKLLGYAEVLLVPASLAYLIVALVRGGRARGLRALALAVVTAITVAQPFGVKGEPITPNQFFAGDPRPAKAEEVHSTRVLGLSLFRFRPYRRKIWYLNGEGGNPTHWLKLRSWLWPGLLTNGSKVERLCGTDMQPCWVPEGDSDTYGRPSNLQLVKSGNEWRYRILTADGTSPKYPPPFRTGTHTYNGYYRLTVGVSSKGGLAYWIVSAALGMALVLRLHRDRRRRT